MELGGLSSLVGHSALGQLICPGRERDNLGTRVLPLGQRTIHDTDGCGIAMTAVARSVRSGRGFGGRGGADTEIKIP